ncbi:4'-phosphopantetheinyl transferase superfamily protein [Robiginitalea sp. SC105]|uniref:4'-phosphopantetheinyl transferase family protein n=1 Tax=Robiginitalea sp. SC105 TaxID=2762332 RepID=UPI00163A3000|nr:4'-phosphopantetheinyl transferase family protein [Robiginitalea sp. SC105]MBC2837949.1 4'-phosphopantetheinyl transferase superfamily protein [Robiginitalea sp. SC105]
MPLYKSTQAGPDCRVHVWKVTEPEAELAAGITLNPHCQQRYDGMRSELHRRAFLSIRHLMAREGYIDADLYYDPAGKPHLRDGTHISITHSFEFTGIILSKSREVGIDIEKQREKILRIAHRFTPIREYRSMANDDALIRKLTMVWCAKESLYKVMAIHGLSFLNHICIDDFAMDSGETGGQVMYDGKKTGFGIDFSEFEGFTCAFAVREEA